MWHRIDADVPFRRCINDAGDVEFQLCFSGTYEPAFPGSWQDPPEAEHFEIEDMALFPVTWSKEIGHSIDHTKKIAIDVSHLTQSELDVIKAAGIEAARTMIERRAHRERE